jgi:hypothetical protein
MGDKQIMMEFQSTSLEPPPADVATPSLLGIGR